MSSDIFLYALISYLYGALPFAFIATYLITRKKLNGEGTGNVGVTNAFKVGGYAVGIATVAGEISKALLPLFLAHRFFSGNLYPTLVLVYCALLGTSFSIFLKGKGGKGTTISIWALLFLSPSSLVILLVLWIVILKVSGGYALIKKIPLIFIPLILFLVERDIIFALFGLLTSIHFFVTSYIRKDDFLHYGIFHKRIEFKEGVKPNRPASKP